MSKPKVPPQVSAYFRRLQAKSAKTQKANGNYARMAKARWDKYRAKHSVDKVLTKRA